MKNETFVLEKGEKIIFDKLMVDETRMIRAGLASLGPDSCDGGASEIDLCRRPHPDCITTTDGCHT